MSEMRKALAILVLAVAAPVFAQTTPQAPDAKAQPQEPPKPRPPLNLSLDPADAGRSRIIFEPRADKKPPVEQTLPGMGGERTRAWEPPSDKIFPPDTATNVR